MAQDKNIKVEKTKAGKMEKHPLEFVERKGLGHPDSLADGISESISRRLCRAYREEFGTIAHHNTDEIQIVAGKSQPSFGGGLVQEPIKVILAGRATRQFDGHSVDVDRLAIKAARDHLDKNVRNLDLAEHVDISCEIGPGSADLTRNYMRGSKIPVSNDTSFGIGHAPSSETEKMVYETEHHLNSDEFKRQYPAVGEDIKVMAYRYNKTISLTAAIAFVGEYIDGIEQYLELKTQIKDEIRGVAQSLTSRDLDLYINTADPNHPSQEDVFLTVTGTSAENGDDGSTGRGNRVNGLITPKRPMSLEAASGKNPVAHVGKIYNILAHYIADQIYEEVNPVEEVNVKLLSQIGRPINDPHVASIEVATENGLNEKIKREIKREGDYWLDNIPEVMENVIAGDVKTF